MAPFLPRAGVAADSRLPTARIRDQIHAVRRFSKLSASTFRVIHAQSSGRDDRVELKSRFISGLRRYNLMQSRAIFDIIRHAHRGYSRNILFTTRVSEALGIVSKTPLRMATYQICGMHANPLESLAMRHGCATLWRGHDAGMRRLSACSG